MKKIIFIGLIILLLTPIFMVAMQINGKSNELAPNFSLTDLNDKQISLSDFKGKPVVLFFWTTWCPYCRQELKTLNNMHESLVKDGVELLTINVGESKSKVNNFVQASSLVFTVLLDRDMAVADSFGILGVPTYFLINKQGFIRIQQHSFPKNKYKDSILE